jgi:YggT family protein
VAEFLRVFIQLFFMALFLVVLGRVLLSWVNPRFDGVLGRFVFETTEPFLAPIRRILPQTGMIDFSPLVLMVIVSLLWRISLLLLR